jgi:hypothetical protein
MVQTRSKRTETDHNDATTTENSERPSKRSKVNSGNPEATTSASELQPTPLNKEEDEDEEDESFQPLEEIRASDLYLDTARPLEYSSSPSDTYAFPDQPCYPRLRLRESLFSFAFKYQHLRVPCMRKILSRKRS